MFTHKWNKSAMTDVHTQMKQKCHISPICFSFSLSWKSTMEERKRDRGARPTCLPHAQDCNLSGFDNHDWVGNHGSWEDNHGNWEGSLGSLYLGPYDCKHNTGSFKRDLSHTQVLHLCSQRKYSGFPPRQRNQFFRTVSFSQKSISKEQKPRRFTCWIFDCLCAVTFNSEGVFLIPFSTVAFVLNVVLMATFIPAVSCSWKKQMLSWIPLFLI